VIAGNTGIGMSQRMQSFVLDSNHQSFQRDGTRQAPTGNINANDGPERWKPFLSFAVQGGDTQDQNLLQFFLKYG
jgi:gamma-glutamyltranspeptidase/glutathione hydrolase